MVLISSNFAVMYYSLFTNGQEVGREVPTGLSQDSISQVNHDRATDRRVVETVVLPTLLVPDNHAHRTVVIPNPLVGSRVSVLKRA